MVEIQIEVAAGTQTVWMTLAIWGEVAKSGGDQGVAGKAGGAPDAHLVGAAGVLGLSSTMGA